jgi:hypothetical protein
MLGRVIIGANLSGLYIIGTLDFTGKKSKYFVCFRSGSADTLTVQIRNIQTHIG